jgi:hypothetical protein
MICAAPPVAARAPSPYTQADSVGDVSIRRGDVTRIRVEHDGPWVQLQFWARVGSNPVTSLSWREGTTRAIWDIEVEGDRDVDFRAVADTTSAGDYHGTVDNVTGGTAACAAEAGFFDGRAYSLTFRRACIGNPARLRVRLDFAFDASVVAGRPVTHDLVPNRGRWSDPISHDPPPPSVSVGRGSSAVNGSDCTSLDCSWLSISYSNLPNGNHSYSCNTANGASFWSGTTYRNGGRVSGSNGSGELWCYADASAFGGVFVVIDGQYRSNTASW